MKILWFTPTASLYKSGSPKHSYNGSGWIASLEEVVASRYDIDLAISFFHETDDDYVRGISHYYPLRKYRMNKLTNLLDKFRPYSPKERYELARIKRVIDEYHPDIIHIFGTEYIFAKAYRVTDIPIVVHLQGLLSPYSEAYYPIGFNRFNLWFFPSKYRDFFVHNTLEDRRKLLKRDAQREAEYFKNIKHFMGRTQWDKSVAELLSSGRCKYHHINEILRPVFYKHAGQWKYHKQQKITICTTISPMIYKGLDLVFKAASLLRDLGQINFEWKVIGIDEQSAYIRFIQTELHYQPRDINLHFLGVLDSDAICNELLSSDVYVHPSYIENSPNSLCEAQMIGVPVIATFVGGIPSIVKHEESGILVPANGSYELAYWIHRITKDTDLSNNLSRVETKLAIKRHAKQAILGALVSVYQEILDKDK